MSGYFILSSIILFGGVQGLLLVFALHHLSGANRPANRILSIFVLLISLVLFSRLVYVDGVEIWKEYPHLFLIPDIPMFLYGPLFYLYVRRLIGSGKLEGWRLWAHFIPAALHCCVLGFYLMDTKVEYMQRLATGNLIELPFAVWASLLHMAIYLSWGFVLYQKNKQKEARQQRFKIGQKYLNSFFIMVGICWLTWFYAVLSEDISTLPTVSFFNYNIAWVAFSFASFFLAYFAMSNPEAFKNDPTDRKYEGSLLTDSALDLLEKKLIGIMANNKPHLDPQLSQQQLADQMGIPPKDLSRLINERFGQHFSDFVNSHRVTEFKRLAALPEKENFTLLALAYEAGFNSKTTFNTAFKKLTGTTPAQFKKIAR